MRLPPTPRGSSPPPTKPMPPPPPHPHSSNIRVAVRWKQSTVFAGEDVEATITFSNIALPATAPAASSAFTDPQWDAPSRAVGGYGGVEGAVRKSASVSGADANGTGNGVGHGLESGGGGGGGGGGDGRQRRPDVARHASLSEARAAAHSRGHRQSQSLALNTAVKGGRTMSGPAGVTVATQTAHVGPGLARTLSILSLGTDAADTTRALGEGRQVVGGHGRAASIQVPLRGGGGPYGAPSPSSGSMMHFSPRLRTTSPTSTAGQTNDCFPPARRSPLSPKKISPPRRSGRGSRASTSPQPPDFSFPSFTSTNSNDAASDAPVPEPDSAVSPLTMRLKPRPHSPRPPDGGSEPVRQVTRLMAGSSINGTPRSSGEFYSQTNNSSETLASEYIQQPTSRWIAKPEPLQRPASQRLLPETLMMGYAQVMGSFTVDGSLVNQAPFEEVKRKGIVGGQGGGGVVGVERSKRQVGLFGALGWGNLGESLSGILGSGELSSIKEMRGIASSKAIPLLSTPQSILFVDLKLGPGESKSYSYAFKLPRGLPPSHKGRAIKLSYHLTIGTQRPGSGKEQQVKSVDVPFRVLGSVNSNGDVLGHDLMTPYILLRDQARTASVSTPDAATAKPRRPLKGEAKPPDESMAKFHSYIASLLSRANDPSAPAALLSPTSGSMSWLHRRSSLLEEPLSMKEAIDFAILRSGQRAPGSDSRSSTRFEIARSGLRVAVVTLARPAYRLGETVNANVDFAGADIPTYAINVTLETSETVDASLALRSAGSISRVTRKVHCASAENVAFARRVGVALSVPWSACPELYTTGVGVRWKIRVEFVGPKLEVRRRSAGIAEEESEKETEQAGEEDDDDDDDDDKTVKQKTLSPEMRLEFPNLLEETHRDRRGAIFTPVERLQCDSFEVEVPIRVYGAVIEAGETADVEGLAV